MSFAEVVKRLKIDPTAYLDNYCVSSLGTFLVGYKRADSSASAAVKALLDVFPGPEQADACTRVYLSYVDSAVGASAVLDALEKMLHENKTKATQRLVFEPRFVEVVRKPIVERRPVIVLGEPTVIALYNFVRGFLTGLEVVSPADARLQCGELKRFENWLQERYRVPGAAWYKLIRVHEGACESGLTRFIQMWDEFAEAVSLQ